jgi:hypothetical protein
MNSGDPTVTTPGGATDTRRRVYNPLYNRPIDLVTFTVERGNPYGKGRRLAFGHVPDLSLTWTEEEATVGGTLIGQKMERGVYIHGNEIQQIEFLDGGATAERLVFDGQTTVGTIDPTTTASQLATLLASLSNLTLADLNITGGPFPEPLVVEFIGDYFQTNVPLLETENVNPDIEITVLVAGGSTMELPEARVPPTEVCLFIGETTGSYFQLDNGVGLEIGLNGMFNQQRVIDCRLPSFKGVVERAPDITGRITIDDDDLATEYLSWLRQNKTFFVKVECESDQLIEVGFPYRYKLEFAMQFMEDEPGAQDDYETAGFDLVGFRSSSLSNSAYRLELDTGVATL